VTSVDKLNLEDPGKVNSEIHRAIKETINSMNAEERE